MNFGEYTLHQRIALQARDDFKLARMRAMLNRLLSTLVGRPGCLRSFSKAQEATTVRGLRDRGVREVPLASIVGSVGRARDFDSKFNPLRSNTRARWERLDMAVLAGDDFPPVELYLLGGDYYVSDGNHRVSVAKHRGMDSIQAVVVEYLTDSPHFIESPLEAAPCCSAYTSQPGLPVL